MSAPEIAAWLTAAIAAATIIGWVGRAAWRTNRQVSRFLTDWFGEPEDPRRGQGRRPGVPERLGVVEERMADVSERMGRIEHELHPNHGASLRDAVDRIERSRRSDGET